MSGREGVQACAQCHQVKVKCSLVDKCSIIPSTPARAHKRPWVGEARSLRGGGAQERVEEVKDKDLWGVRPCEAIMHINAHLIKLTEAARWQNELLGCLVELLEEERMTAAWRQQWQEAWEERPV